MNKNTIPISELHTKLLSQKISSEYAISCSNYPGNNSYVDIVYDAYYKAKALFDPSADNSICTETLSLYLENVEKNMESFLSDSTAIESMLILFKAIIKIQKLINSGSEKLTETFSAELINHKDYYNLFDIDYYLESARTKGIESSLSELEDDVNTRANTYFNAAYKAYVDFLPGFCEFAESLVDS